MSRILLLVNNSQTHLHCVKLLHSDHELYTEIPEPFETPTFELCLVDKPTLTQIWQQIQRWKAAVAPLFLPLLCICDPHPDHCLGSPGWQNIDESITLPLIPAEFLNRVQRLLHFRHLTLQLQAQAKTIAQLQQKITTQEEQHRQVQERFSLLSRMITESTNGFLIVNQQGRVCFANPMAESMFNQTLLNQDFGIPIVATISTQITIIRPNGALGMGEMKVINTLWHNQSAYLIILEDITERWQTEQTLEVQQEQFHLLVESEKNRIPIQLDANGMIISWNVGAQQLFGYTLPEVMGQYFGKFYPPQAMTEELPWQDLQTACTHKRLQQERHFQRADQSLFWAQQQITPLYYETQDLRGFIMVIQDITDWKQAETERAKLIRTLQKTETRFKDLVETTSDLIWEVNEQFLYTYLSSQIYDILGYMPEEVLGTSYFDLMAQSEEQSGESDLIQAFQQAQTLKNIEQKVNNKQGQFIFLEISAVPILDETGTFKGYFGVARNITERRCAETNLLKSQKLLAQTEAMARIGSWDFDLKTKVITWSAETFRIFECPPQWGILKYREILQQIHPDDRRLCQQQIKAGLRGKAPEKFNFRMLNPKPNSSIKYLQTRMKSVLDSEGNVVELVGTVQDITERHLLEEKIRTSEAEMRGLLEAIPDIILMIDAQSSQIEVAPTHSDRFRDNAAALIQATCNCFLQPETAKTFWSPIRQALGFQEPVNFEYHLPAPPADIWFSASIAPLSETSVIWVARDITDLKETEWELSEERSRYRSVVEDQTELICRFLPDCTLTFVNEAYCRYFNRRRYQLLNTKFIPLIPPEDWELVKTQMQELLKLTPENPSKITEHRVIVNGKISWIQWTDRGIFNEAQELVEFQGIGRDITERVLAETALKESETRFRAIFEQASVGIAIVNLESRFVRVNQRFCDILGYSPTELKTLTCTEINDPDTLTTDHQQWQQIVRGEIQTFAGEKRYLRKNQTPVWVNLTVSLMRDSSGTPQSIIKVIQDINDRKQTELELQAAKEAAEVANQAKSEFLASMSHELRTPLNGILGYTQILQRDPQLTPEQKDSINTIQKCGEHLLTLINDILDLSKIEARKMELSLTECDFHNFLESIAHLFQMRAAQKQIHFEYQALSPLPKCIQTDEKRLRQVLINLLSNAVKFTDTGQVTFKVGLVQSFDPPGTPSPTAPDQIRFQVEDTGIGIEPHQVSQLFQPFQQVSDRRHFVEGTGLGLAISQKLVQMMGGEIHVQSQWGAGTIFYFEIHLPEVGNHPASFQLESPQQSPKMTGFIGDQRKVMIVDDQTVNRKVIRHLLVPLGFEVCEAMNGTDCLQKAVQFQPDLIFMDLVMPDLNGLEVTQKLRQFPPLANVIIIVVSANVFDQIQHQSLEAGCDGFLPKPIQVPELLKCLETYLGLEWVYESHPPQKRQQNKPEGFSFPIILDAHPNPDIIVPPTQDIQNLLKLVMSGDIGGIIQETERLTQINEQWHPFLSQLSQMAKNFQLKQIRELLQKYSDF